MLNNDESVARFQTVRFDVRSCASDTVKSHAGIFITVNGETLRGGERLRSIGDDTSQDFLLLLIQRRLVEIARKKLFTV